MRCVSPGHSCARDPASLCPQTQLVRGMAAVGELVLAEEYRLQAGLPPDTLAPPDPGESSLRLKQLSWLAPRTWAATARLCNTHRSTRTACCQCELYVTQEGRGAGKRCFQVAWPARRWFWSATGMGKAGAATASTVPPRRTLRACSVSSLQNPLRGVEMWNRHNHFLCTDPGGLVGRKTVPP